MAAHERREGQIALLVDWEDGSVAPLHAAETREECEAQADDHTLQEMEEIVILPATFLSN